MGKFTEHLRSEQERLRVEEETRHKVDMEALQKAAIAEKEAHAALQEFLAFMQSNGNPGLETIYDGSGKRSAWVLSRGQSGGWQDTPSYGVAICPDGRFYLLHPDSVAIYESQYPREAFANKSAFANAYWPSRLAEFAAQKLRER